MKNEINPAVAAIVVVILVAIVGFFIYRRTGGETATNQSNPMPKAAAEGMKAMMGKMGNKSGN